MILSHLRDFFSLSLWIKGKKTGLKLWEKPKPGSQGRRLGPATPIDSGPVMKSLFVSVLHQKTV